MATGLFGGFTDLLFGKAGGPESQFPGSKELGSEFQKFLMDRLKTPVQDTEQFRLGRGAIRDATTDIAATARQRLGDAGVQGGFLDSGNLQLSGNLDIDRAELNAFGAAVRDLILGLEEQRTAGILPFLSGGQQAEGQQSGFELGMRGQNIDFFNEQTRQASEFFSNFTPGKGGCWIARAVFGDDDPRWLDARRYLFNGASQELFEFYMTYGPVLGYAARRVPWLREALRPLVTFMAAQGAV